MKLGTFKSYPLSFTNFPLLERLRWAYVEESPSLLFMVAHGGLMSTLSRSWHC